MTSARRPAWKVVLVVEDDTDGRALRHLAEASGLRCQVDWVPAGGVGNIKRRGAQLIGLAKDRVRDGNGCVAVLVDRDGNDAAEDEPHKSIREHCHRARVPYLEAVECFESWCLADPGICRWLEIKPPACSDLEPDPKGVVSRAYYKKTGRPYRKRRARTKLARKATGVDAARSPSWRTARGRLDEC